MKQNYLLVALIVGLGATSCKKKEDTDTTAPSITVTSPKSDGESNVVELRGEYFELIGESKSSTLITGVVTDNEELKELKIDVHNSNDGHTHGKSASTFTFLDLDTIISVSGKTSYAFNIPLNHPINSNLKGGLYDVIVNATDKDGNQTSFANNKTVLRGIYLERAYQASIVNNEDTNSEKVEEIDLAVGANLDLNGFIEQKRGGKDLAVSFIKIEIAEDEDHDHDHDDKSFRLKGEGDAVFEAYWGTAKYFTDENGAKLSGNTLPSFDGDNKLMFSDLLATVTNYKGNAAHNHYKITISVEDEAGNLTLRVFELEVK